MSNPEEKAQFTTSLQKTDEFPVGFPVNYQQPEEEIHLRDYIRVIMRRKWTVITFFLVVVSTVVIGTFLMTPIYRSAVTIKIDKENPQVLKFKDVYEVERAEEDYYQTQYKIFKSRNLAKRVIRALKLDQNPEFIGVSDTLGKKIASLAPEDISTSNTEENIPQGVVDSFLGRVTVEPQQRSRLVKISFDSRSPQTATTAANEIARSYIDFNIESKFDATQQARDWLEKQLQDMKAKVERAEEDLNRYAAQKGIIFVSEQGGSDTKDNPRQNIVANSLSQMSNNLVQAASDRIAKEALYRESQQADPDSASAVLSNPLIQALKKDYVSAEVDYSQLSKVYKPDYPKMVRLREHIDQLKAKIKSETAKIISGIKSDYEAAVKREEYLKSALGKYKNEALNLNDKMVQYQILKREADTNRELYNGLLQRLKEIGVSASLTASNVQVLDRAEMPKTPHKPQKRLNFMLAVIVGLFGGVGLAFFVEYLDNTVKTPDDIEKAVSLPSLGLVPNFSGKNEKDKNVMVTFEDKKSPLSEAYRSIGTYIQFSSAVKPPRTMLVTSPRQSEGKTTTAVNTAITLAHSYGKGIIIDCDMRKPRLHKIFDMDNTNGLSTFLTGNTEFSNSLIQKTRVENLDIITAGIIPPNPSELLSSSRMRDLINVLFPLYSFAIFDSPPVLGLSDSLVLSTLTDGVIMVVKAGDTPRDVAVKARKLIQGVNAKILGVVLNGITASDLKYGYYSYYYSYYYEDESDKHKDKEKNKRVV